MTDQPNRPAFRMTQTSFSELETLMRSTFLDGIMQGMPLAKNITLAVQSAILFGRDEAMRSDHMPWRVGCRNITELVQEAVAVMLDGMFSAEGISKTLYKVMMMGVAYGFRSEKEIMREAATRAEHPAANAALEAMLASRRNGGPASTDLAEAFFAEILKLDSKVATTLAKIALSDNKVKFDSKAVPSFKKYFDQYAMTA
jgi:hypothetical protein